VRIAGKDAAVLGLTPPEEAPAAPLPEGPLDRAQVEERVWQELKTCFDPEIPVNIVDLGLVYECKVTEHPDGGFRVAVEMTLTAPGCGMGDILKDDAEAKIRAIPGVQECAVALVLEPPWDPSRMSDVARLQLNML
jgi:probable FeS assembly SUF system protein SufT